MAFSNSEIGRLAGSILVFTQGRYYLVGDLKEPCNWEEAGFEKPADFEPMQNPWHELTPVRKPVVSEPRLMTRCEGEVLLKALHRIFVIERNGSVSDRLWRRVVWTEQKPEGENETNVDWLLDMPVHLWGMVREQVLKCS